MPRIIVALLIFMALLAGDLRGFKNPGGLGAAASAADFMGAEDDVEYKRGKWRKLLTENK